MLINSMAYLCCFSASAFSCSSTCFFTFFIAYPLRMGWSTTLFGCTCPLFIDGDVRINSCYSKSLALGLRS